MGSVKKLSGREIGRILETQGFMFIRQKGSHRIYKLGSARTVIVPNHKEVTIGTLQSIIRQSQLPRNLFESP
ncbi:MAG: type II toxin-antitoxin system HicA family toxin [Fimbriimonadaceae bacterium]